MRDTDFHRTTHFYYTYFLNDLLTNDFATRLLVLEHQTVLVGVNRNGLLAPNLVRKNLL